MTFGEKVLDFNGGLEYKLPNLPEGFKAVNPFERETVRKITAVFYKKYYGDTNARRIILGSSPARRGSAVTGVPFADAGFLQRETGILIDNFRINKASSGFLEEVIEKYGGYEKFYSEFYMNFVCPVGIVKKSPSGGEVNCNYYEGKRLKDALSPFILKCLETQMRFGMDNTVCLCIGSGENYRFLSEINEKRHFFEKIIPLEHPRYIMQYNKNKKNLFIEKYLDALCDA